jgi:hypothetical protein
MRNKKNKERKKKETLGSSFREEIGVTIDVITRK